MTLMMAIGVAIQTPPDLPAAAARAPSSDAIVVTAQRNADALAKCLRQGCPPIQDMTASIAVAEDLFARGDYRQARSVLGRSIARNKRHAATLPVAVAALYEASANVNLHLGDSRAFRDDTANRVRIIRASAPADSDRQVLAGTLLGDMWFSLGEIRQADISYRTARSEAARLGMDRLAAFLDLRRVGLRIAGKNLSEAETLLAGVENGGVADAAVRRTAAAMRVRLASASKRGPALDRAIAAFAALPASPDPILLKYDAIHESTAEAVERASRAWGIPEANIPSGAAVTHWIDVGFSIGADGTVRDAEVLRGTMQADRVAAILRHIRSRRYARLALAEGSSSVYRVERYTLRSRLDLVKGSLIRQRAGAAKLEMLDITNSYAPPPESGA